MGYIQSSSSGVLDQNAGLDGALRKRLVENQDRQWAKKVRHLEERGKRKNGKNNRKTRKSRRLKLRQGPKLLIKRSSSRQVLLWTRRHTSPNSSSLRSKGQDTRELRQDQLHSNSLCNLCRSLRGRLALRFPLLCGQVVSQQPQPLRNRESWKRMWTRAR